MNGTPDPKQLLASYTGDDELPSAYYGLAFTDRRRPVFRPAIVVPDMMADARVNLALWYLKGTLLSLGRFYVLDTSDPDGIGQPSAVKQFVVEQITRWWRNSAAKQLTAIEWGWSACETMFRVKNGMVQFDHLRLIHPTKAAPMTVDGSLVGVAIDSTPGGKIFLAAPKSLWHVHGREINPFWGRSRLYAAYDPWLELSQYGGARDVRRLYYYKSSYQGDTIYHPEGQTPMPDGTLKPNKEIAREVVTKLRAGGVLTLPSTRDTDGNLLWEIVPRETNDAGPTLDLYVESLKEEINEGIGVPSELIRAAETGSGYSGRKVPQTGFRGMLSELLYWAVADFNEQVLSGLVKLNFGCKEPPYEIIPFGLLDDQNETGDPNDDPADAGSDGPDTKSQIPPSAREAAKFSAVV